MHDFCTCYFEYSNKNIKKMKLFLLFLITFSLSAQPRIAFDTSQHSFGSVNEVDGAVSYDFTFRNTGTAPLIILNVSTTCDCTAPDWSRQPIRPGETGFVRVAYDVRGRPGAINSSVTVQTNSSPPTNTLRITGDVIPIERRPETFRHTAGAIRLDNMHVSFNRIFSHQRPTLVVTAHNPSPDPVRISFVDLPPHITAEVVPATIRQGERAQIRVTYDAARKNDWGFVSDRINMILNDNRAAVHNLTVTATIEEDFSRWTAAQLQNAPSISVDQQVINGGQIRRGERKTYNVRLTNTGRSALAIRKVDAGNNQLLSVDAPNEINPGASADMTVTFNSAGQSGEQNRAITLITNDPRNAQITVRLRAEVVE